MSRLFLRRYNGNYKPYVALESQRQMQVDVAIGRVMDKARLAKRAGQSVIVDGRIGYSKVACFTKKIARTNLHPMRHGDKVRTNGWAAWRHLIPAPRAGQSF